MAILLKEEDMVADLGTFSVDAADYPNENGNLTMGIGAVSKNVSTPAINGVPIGTASRNDSTPAIDGVPIGATSKNVSTPAIDGVPIGTASRNDSTPAIDGVPIGATSRNDSTPAINGVPIGTALRNDSTSAIDGVPIDATSRNDSTPAINGVPISYGVTISMTKSELESIVSKLRNAKQNMESIWNDIINNDVMQITNSWAGQDCSSYIQKINQAQISASFEAIELLIRAYTNALMRITELQNQNMNILGSL